MATPSRTSKPRPNASQGEVQTATGTRMSADEIYESVSKAAEEELDRPAGALIWSAVAAGLAISFSFFTAAFLASLAPAGREHAAAAIGYPLGFIFVVLARSQLFTENTLEPVIPLLRRPTGETFRKVLGLWAAVLAGNLVGAVVIALVAVKTRMLEESLHGPLQLIARSSTEGGFGTVLWKAIFAGWLVALMAWLVASTHSTFAQVTLIWLTTAPIAAFGFRHSIAGAVEAFYRAFSGDASWGGMLGGFLAPALIGNMIGGVLIVALLNHGQVMVGKQEHEKPG